MKENSRNGAMIILMKRNYIVLLAIGTNLKGDDNIICFLIINIPK
jgi:hypothetical protein